MSGRLVYIGVMKTFVCALVLLFPLSVFSAEITADSYLLVEKDSFQIIAGKDYHRSLPPASTTKVMTAILALERLGEQDSVVPTKQVLSIPPSTLSLRPGTSYRAIDLIKGALVKSANDAAYSLAVAVAGSEERFADMMNEKARELGAGDTNFRNASGLHLPDHRSSAYDLALIFRYALNNKRFQEIIGTKYFLFNEGDRDVRYMNHNRLLFCFQPSIGGKTGFTRISKHCYVGAFEKEGKTYILSMLGSKNLWPDACNILQQIYPDVPTEREISLAKASSVVLSSYRVPDENRPTPRKQLRRTAKRNVRARSVAYTKSRGNGDEEVGPVKSTNKKGLSRKKPVKAKAKTAKKVKRRPRSV
jgi:serine-type D-Ala-D-Ala carboxypeptidase (penicillin-binding protein 5/6)